MEIMKTGTNKAESEVYVGQPIYAESKKRCVQGFK